jgi:uncharacterized protein (DUF1800 family)
MTALGLCGAHGVRWALRWFGKSGEIGRELAASLCLAVVLASLATIPLPALAAHQQPPKSRSRAVQEKPRWNQPLTSDERILQLLNRITFGPRPGDVEHVRQIGLNAFLKQQLHPERISDSAVEARLLNLPTLTMTSQELVDNYPPPKPALKQEEGQKVPPSNLERSKPGGRAEPSPSAQSEGNSSPDTMTTSKVPTSDSSPLGKTRPSPGEMGPAGEQMTSAESAAKTSAGPTGGPGARGDQMIQGPQRVIIELAQEELLRAVYSERQLQEVMVQFWMNHFNIFAPKGADRWLVTSFERDTIRPYSMGKFQDLLLATAQSPAMLFYLDNWQSAAPGTTLGALAGGPAPRRLGSGQGSNGAGRSAAFNRPPANQRNSQSLRPQQAQQAQGKKSAGGRKPGLNENYGRELMELHTLGVSGGYTQKDVIEVARCLTGWSIDRPQLGGGFVFRPQMHDYGKKVVLGHTIQAGGGMEDGLQVVHILAHQPATAQYISLKLCRRLVADDPPPSVVDRATKAFLKSDGDIRAVLKSILTSPEFFSQAAYRAKVKSPLELVASSMRALGAETEAGPQAVQFIARMGEPMFQYQAPTGFPDRASTWINSGTLLVRMKYAMALAANRIRGTEINWSAWAAGNGSDPQHARLALLDRLNQVLLGGSLTTPTREAILKQAATGPDAATAEPRSKWPIASSEHAASGGAAGREPAMIAAMVLAAPEFQRR